MPPTQAADFRPVPLRLFPSSAIATDPLCNFCTAIWQGLSFLSLSIQNELEDTHMKNYEASFIVSHATCFPATASNLPQIFPAKKSHPYLIFAFCMFCYHDTLKTLYPLLLVLLHHTVPFTKMILQNLTWNIVD